MNFKTLALAGIGIGIVGALAVIIFPIGYSPKPQKTPQSVGKFQLPSPSESPSQPIPSPSESSKSVPSSDLTLSSQQTALAKQILQQVKTLEQQGRAMEPLRKSSDLSQSRKCGELMRQRQPIAVQLEEKANTLPPASPIRVHLATAALNTKLCVSCSESVAPTYCKNAREYIGNAQSAIAQLSK